MESALANASEYVRPLKAVAGAATFHPNHMLLSAAPIRIIPRLEPGGRIDREGTACAPPCPPRPPPWAAPPRPPGAAPPCCCDMPAAAVKIKIAIVRMLFLISYFPAPLPAARTRSNPASPPGPG